MVRFLVHDISDDGIHLGFGIAFQDTQTASSVGVLILLREQAHRAVPEQQDKQVGRFPDAGDIGHGDGFPGPLRPQGDRAGGDLSIIGLDLSNRLIKNDMVLNKVLFMTLIGLFSWGKRGFKVLGMVRA